MKRHPSEYGNTFIATTVGVDGKWYAITFLTAAKFTSLTDTAGDAWDASIGTITFPAGTTIYGEFTRVTLASGSAWLYKQRDNA